MAKEAKNIITTICDEQCSLSDKVIFDPSLTKSYILNFDSFQICFPIAITEALRSIDSPGSKQKEARQVEEARGGQTRNRELSQNSRRSYNVNLLIELMPFSDYLLYDY